MNDKCISPGTYHAPRSHPCIPVPIPAGYWSIILAAISLVANLVLALVIVGLLLVVKHLKRDKKVVV